MVELHPFWGRLMRDGRAGRTRPSPGPALAVLELRTGADRALAVVGDVVVDAFEDGRVLPHEQVGEERVAELVGDLERTGATSSPVALAQPPHPQVTAAAEAVAARSAPDVVDRVGAGTDVALRMVVEPAMQAELRDAVAAAGRAVVVDGHHRAAAAVRYAHQVGAGPQDAAGRVLCAVLPTDHLLVRAFHRRVDGVTGPDGDPGGQVVAGFDRLRARGAVVDPLPEAALPDGPHVVTVAAGGRWWRCDARALVRTDDVVEALDVRLVERDLLPLLVGRHAARAVPVPAPDGLVALEVAGAVGLALHPPTIADVLTVAGAGRLVPPKTTYVTPKLRSGLLVTPRPSPPGPRRS